MTSEERFTENIESLIDMNALVQAHNTLSSIVNNELNVANESNVANASNVLNKRVIVPMKRGEE